MEQLIKSQVLGFLQGIGTTEIILIFFVILLLFGAKKLPELAHGLGKSIREFKKATSEIEDDIRTAIDTEPTKPAEASKAPPPKPPAPTEESKTE